MKKFTAWIKPKYSPAEVLGSFESIKEANEAIEKEKIKYDIENHWINKKGSLEGICKILDPNYEDDLLNELL